MDYLKAFLVGGFLCLIGQILIDRTKLTPARILVSYVVAGVVLGAVGVYKPLAEFAGAGASVPLTGFGYTLSKGAREAVDTDVVSFHNYSQNSKELHAFYQRMDEVLEDKNFQVNKQLRASFCDGYHYQGQPLFLDEFGGVAYQKKGDSAWGYGTAGTEEEYLKRIHDLVEAIVTNDRIAGFCYTQITDVEAEQNGLLDVERHPKANIDALRAIVTMDGK